MPSVRAVIARKTFGGVVSALKRWRERDTGPIGPDASDELFEAGAIAVREALELMTRSSIRARGVDETQAIGAPVPTWWFVPTRPTDGRVVLYLHGGAYVAGSHGTHRGLASAFARAAGARIVLPEYRLAPENRFPAAVDDALDTYRWLLEVEGVAADQIVFAGDSAGAGLVVSTALAAKAAGLPQPAGLACMSPWTDLTGTGESLVTNEGADIWLDSSLVVPGGRIYAGTQASNPLASPLFGDHRGLPPTLVHVGGNEVLLDDSRRLVARMRAAGVDASLGVFAGMWHVFQAVPGIPEGRRSLREMGAFVRRVTAAAPAMSTSDR
jgi:monoterpene epsilon-lactone hydrolase